MTNIKRSLNRREAILRGAAAAAGAAVAPSLAGCVRESSSMRLIKAITFPGTYNLMVWAAQENGLFADEALSVERTQTTTSMYLIENLVDGAFDVAASSIDNVVAYDEGQGEISLHRPADLIAVAGIMPNAVLPLIVQADIHSFEDLKGKTLAVDAVSTGFSFVLRKILEKGGLGMDDYELVSVGSARDRLESLKAGEHAGAILTAPFDSIAVDAGMKRLADSTIAFDNYQATSFITTRRWATANAEALTAFLRVMIRSLEWLKNPANHEEAATILRRRMTSMSEDAARSAVAAMTKSTSLTINPAGVDTVLALRSQYGRPQKTLSDPSRYIDASYLSAARESL